ncbi:MULTISPECIES: right-handed parallel beta-helix repeat-containing protein [Klebsiella]|nr:MULTISPECIES: right-handed parallel beta-helix repeat-containing protein [Klebsiella]EJB5617146.1 right-handed parallel beta-helix repeat-containing protein [Klebsiella oxytoca]MBX4646411.1 right-handed parallel beta-helix repeat-containing protein [Klebsiella michiganensis]MBZ7436638.1 right-handed parallel beta-helix repeat-containing protein [Klebsiella michiganensis]MDL4449837.1 right-handed parallel beta-helix repeat-containing protein [Klebsiella michiganensis]MDM7050119.1 right-hande
MAADELNPPLGTTTPEIFLENVKRADRLVNGPAGTVDDRGGEPLDTWRQMMAKNDEVRQNIIPLSKQYMTLAAAQADIANIPEGSSTYYRSPDDSALAIEVMNVAGNLQETGRRMISKEYVDALKKLINVSSDNNLTFFNDVDDATVTVQDDFGDMHLAGMPGSVRDRLKTLQANKAPAILRLTDAENAAYASVDEYGHLRLSGMTDSVQERLDTLKKRVDEMRKRRMILDVRECGRHGEARESSTRRLQRGFDWLSGEGGGFLYNPPGYFELYQPVIPRSGVSLLGAGEDATIFLPMGYLPAFQYRGKPTEASPEIYLENIQFFDFSIDGENQQLHPISGYIPDIKGIFLQYYRNAVFDRITIRNTGATGFGMDMHDRASIFRCLAENCGRLATVGALGASGFGIGTSFLSSEPFFASQLIGRNNKNFGIFFEPQRGTGTSQDAIVTDSTFYGNYAGLADCGIEGLIASNLNLRENQYGFVAEPGTNGGGNPGFRGKLNNLIIKGNAKHGMYFNTGKSAEIIGEYAITGGHISENGEDGINVRYASEVTNKGLRISDVDISDNGRHGVNFEAGPVVNAHITNSRFWNNGRLAPGNGINSIRSVKKSRFAMNSFYDFQDVPTQQYPVYISGDMEDVDISFNHGAGNVHNELNLTGNKTRVTTLSNPGIDS